MVLPQGGHIPACANGCLQKSVVSHLAGPGGHRQLFGAAWGSLPWIRVGFIKLFNLPGVLLKGCNHHAIMMAGLDISYNNQCHI